MKWVGVVNAGDSISIKAVLTDPANHATIDVSSAGNGLWLELFG